MITPVYARAMARYNRWQNLSLMSAGDKLDEGDRQLDRGAFFGSIFSTMNHLLWADRLWLQRLAGGTRPRQSTISASVSETDSWPAYQQARKEQDGSIIDWADGLTEAALAGDFSWHSKTANRRVTQPKAVLIAHFFNHQTHHRGQIHAMLTAAGANPDDTDLFMTPDM